MSAAEQYRDRATSLSYRNKAFINGKYVDAASGETFDCVSPIDGKLLTSVAACDKEDVNRAVAAARAAFESGAWSEANPKDRKKTLLRFAGLIEKHKDELALLETLDMGKPITFALNVDLGGVVRTVQWYTEAVEKL